MIRTSLIVGMAVATILLVAGKESAAPGDPAKPVSGVLTEYDRVNLEKNLRWVLAHERKLRDAEKNGNKIGRRPRVAVFADAGVWHIGGRSIVEALEHEGVPCRVLDRSLLTKDGLAGVEALIFPGGWAPHQWSAAGKEGLAAIKAFVEKGGRCLGICAGAYLLSKTVRYEGKEYPYPLGLFDGVAEGPVPGLAPFPKAGAARLKLTEAGKRRGLAVLDTHSCYYSGGPCFVGGTGSEVLARYADGSAGVIARPVGKGEIVLIGAHPERPDPALGGDTAPPPRTAGKVLRALVTP